MARKSSKSETLTIRLDPKIRFMLEFVARVRGQTITTVVERAITESANAVRLREGEFAEEGWRDFWSVIEGERALALAADPLLHPTFEEERRLAFARKHWAFFYTSDKAQKLRTSFIEILWPRIDEFVEIDEAKKSTDFWAAAIAMQEAIRAAGVKPPDWPQKKEPERPKTSPPAFEPGSDDDDIPF